MSWKPEVWFDIVTSPESFVGIYYTVLLVKLKNFTEHMWNAGY